MTNGPYEVVSKSKNTTKAFLFGVLLKLLLKRNAALQFSAGVAIWIIALFKINVNCLLSTFYFHSFVAVLKQHNFPGNSQLKFNLP